MLLTAYSGDPRIPLAGVLKYTHLLKKAVHTHMSSKPKPGTSTLHIVSTFQDTFASFPLIGPDGSSPGRFGTVRAIQASVGPSKLK